MNLNLCSHFLFAIACLLFGPTDVVPAQNWPQFRGPAGNGVLESLEHPQEWSVDKNIAWSVELPGGGLSSPIVHGDRIFVTTAIGMKPPVSFMEGVRDMRPKKPDAVLKFNVICLKLEDGSKLWEKTIAEELPQFPIHASNSYATESPATDGKHLFVYFAAIGKVAAFDFDGNEVWQQDIGAYPTGNGFGTGSSLTTGAGNVFIQCDNDENSFVVAFDGTTGDEVWRRDRDSRTSWSTPLFWKNEQRAELVTCGSGFVISYDPKSGEELWTMSDIGMSFSASPAADNEQIYFGNSGPRSSGPLIAVSAGMSGSHPFAADAEIENLAWSKMQAGPGMASPVSVGGYLFIPGRGILSCYSTANGEVVFKERLNWVRWRHRYGRPAIEFSFWTKVAKRSSCRPVPN